MNRLSAIPQTSPSSALKTSNQYLDTICLKTDSAGRVALSNDWFETINEAHTFEKIYIQTRHAYGRLVAFVQSPKLTWIEENCLAADETGRFLIRPTSESSVVARVEFCDCCASPGRVEFRNEHGIEFLQLCAPSNLQAIDWGIYVDQLSKNANAACTPSSWNTSFPLVPGNAKQLPLHPSMIATIVDWLADRGAAIEATLVTRETIHRRTIRPTSVELADDFLGVYAEGISLQIGLAAARCLFLSKTKGKLQLFLGGPDNTQLLCIEPANDKDSYETFTDILEDLVPELM